jgi:hypothetical protein
MRAAAVACICAGIVLSDGFVLPAIRSPNTCTLQRKQRLNMQLVGETLALPAIDIAKLSFTFVCFGCCLPQWRLAISKQSIILQYLIIF